MMQLDQIQKQNIGSAGEYYIAALLSALNFTVTITLGRAERYDLLVVNPKGRTYKVSIKTRIKEGSSGFMLADKDERNFSDDLFYVFVRLHGFTSEPEYWVIPSRRVAEIISSAHKKFQEAPGKGGRQHSKSSFCRLPIAPAGADKIYYEPNWGEETQTQQFLYDICPS